MADSIGKLMKPHVEPLRKYWNKIFHPREDLEDIRLFLRARLIEFNG